MAEGKTTKDNTKDNGEESHVNETHVMKDLPPHRSGTLGMMEELARKMGWYREGGEGGPAPVPPHHPGTPGRMEKTSLILDGMIQGWGEKG